MPITTPLEVLSTDKLLEGKVKINSNFSSLEAFVNLLESAGGTIVPEDVQNLIVGGKINPAYLETYLSSVTASEVPVVDAGGNFTGTNVETVLAELFTSVSSVSGSTWYTQPGVPASGLGVVGDYYLNTTTGDLYEKTGTTIWSFRVNLKGEDGAPGAGTGDVVGPASAVSGRFASFSGTTGKVIADSGVSASSFATSAQGVKADTAVQPTRELIALNSITGGGSLSANRNFSLVGDSASPGNNYVYGTNASGVKGWKPDPAGGGLGDVVGPASAVNERIAVFNGTTGKLIKDGGTLISGLATAAQGALASTAVQPARSILTTNSLQNGGDLSANRTLSLVGDVASPGNNKVYGTDGTGTRGWKDDPTGGTGTATSTSVSSSRAITNSDHNKILMCTGTITLTLPSALQQDLQFIALNIGSGSVSFALSGGSTVTPSGVVLDNTTGATLTAASVLNVSNNWYIDSTRQDTVTVLYSAGWPVSRPNAVHVLAIGHTSAPVWLTAEDVWFENVV